MSKPETNFYTAVHKFLPPVDELHREKMSNPYRGGTADHWYSGKNDLWIEWKFEVLPVRDTTLIDICGGKKPSLSHLQQDWLRCRYAEGRDVYVIIGSKEGGVIMTEPSAGRFAWERPITAAHYRANLMTRKEIAAWIQQRVT